MGKTAVVETLDLDNLVKKAVAGVFDSPTDALSVIRTAWETHITTRSAQANDEMDVKEGDKHKGQNKVTATPTLPSEADLADALLIVQHCWLEESLEGLPLSEEEFAMHAVNVNHKNIKSALGQMLNWSQRNRWEGFVPAVKAMREEAAKKAGGPYRTYSQVIAAVNALVATAKSELRGELTNNKAGKSGAKKEMEKVDDEEREELEEYFVQLERWIWEKWEENGLPQPLSKGNGDGAGKLTDASPTRRSSRPNGGRPTSNGAGNKRVRYTEDEEDDDFLDGDESDEGDNEPLMKKIKKKEKEATLKTEKQTGAGNNTHGLKDVGSPACASGNSEVEPMSSLPPGAKVSPDVPNAVVVTVDCYGLKATALIVRPNLTATPGKLFSTPTSRSMNFGDTPKLPTVAKLPPSSPVANGANGNGNGTVVSPTPKSPKGGHVSPLTSSPYPVVKWVEGQGIRCARNDGKQWRCSMTAVPNGSFCPHHRQKTSASPSGSGSDSTGRRQSHSGAAVGNGRGAGLGSGVSGKGGDEVRYTGPPVEIRILAVAGVPVDAARGDVLASPAAFEAHAFTIAQEVAAAAGPSATRLTPLGMASPKRRVVVSPLKLGNASKVTSSGSSFGDGPDQSAKADKVKKKLAKAVVVDDMLDNELFRLNATVCEKEDLQVWTRYYDYEVKLMAAVPSAWVLPEGTAAEPTPGVDTTRLERAAADVIAAVRAKNADDLKASKPNGAAASRGHQPGR